MALESTELTSDLLHTLFEYRDGKLFWRARNGKEAGCVGNRGYSCVCINYRKYMTHRLIWIMHGNTPEPAPEPPAPIELTTEQKLEAAGLSVDELKTLFGLT